MTPYYSFKKLIYVFIEHRLIYVREKGLSFLTDRTQFFFFLAQFQLERKWQNLLYIQLSAEYPRPVSPLLTCESSMV